MPTKTIAITQQDGTSVAKGTLVVDTSGPSNTGTFTPTEPVAGSLMNCTGSIAWPTSTGGTVNFGFQVAGPSNNGSFPPGTYRFNGTQNANGNPSGTIAWPGGHESDDDDDDDDDVDATGDDTWQASG